MRKFITIVISLILVISLSGCYVTIQPDMDDDNQTLVFVEAHFYEYFDDKECVALLFDYTNESGESKCASDAFVMGVRQNDELLDTLWVGGDKRIPGTITPSVDVETDTTARVAWLFVLRDDSPITVKVSDGQEFTIEYGQIVKK